MRKEWVVGVVVLLTCVFMGPALMEPPDRSMENINPLEQWLSSKKQMGATGGSSHVADNPRESSYMDGPSPLTNDDGSYRGVPSDGQACGWGENCYVSDSMISVHRSLENFSVDPVKAAGNFVVGNDHESNIGDKNGNGVLEWVVIYAYLPWMFDGMDNDGDGCIDERGHPDWSGQIGCDNMIDAAVVYETGGQPIIGGDRGDLLINLDWYSVTPSVKIFRATVSPRFHAYSLRGVISNLQIAGEFVSYQANEAENNVNSNPDVDSDLDDYYVGNIDARLFPARMAINNICSAGLMTDEISPSWKRADGHVITTYELVESFDNRDWNGDGDIDDNVVAYYTVDPNTGYCRIGVNTAVQGHSPVTSGEIITPEFTYESSDSRDWDRNGMKHSYVQLYHDVNSTWSLRGRIYQSHTYFNIFISLQGFGFGWWAVIRDDWDSPVIPFEFGGAYTKYVGRSMGYYHSYFFLTSDEDGNRHTTLPEHYIFVGRTMGVVGNICILIGAWEIYMEYAGVNLIGGRADANGNGFLYEFVSLIFCPEEVGGGGSFIVDPTSKFAKGQYDDPVPVLWEGYTEYGVFPGIDGNATIPSFSYAWCKLNDLQIPIYSGRKVDQVYQIPVW
jgi:hypothetical protein